MERPNEAILVIRLDHVMLPLYNRTCRIEMGHEYAQPTIVLFALCKQYYQYNQ